MSYEELLNAMRHGGEGPSQARHSADLGRFGLGLKTASLSQCRQLTVVTLKAAVLSASRWDLDVVEQHGDWTLQILDDAEIAPLPRLVELLAQESGTIVLWRDLDRALEGSLQPDAGLSRLIDDSREHLALVFHRYINPTPTESGCAISINSNPLERFDPFLTSNPATEELQTERVTMDGGTVLIRPFILPHLSRLTRADLRVAGSGDSLKQSQGFYVYRNRRLISYGTWFRLIKQDDLTKLARVSIDIPNTLDSVWGIDVRKATATPPEAVRTVLRRIIDRIADRGANVFRERRRPTGSTETTYLWLRSRIRDATLYTINRAHPLLTSLRIAVSSDASIALERTLKALELALPTMAIYADIGRDTSLDPSPDDLFADLKSLALGMLDGLENDSAPKAMLLKALPSIEPFSKYPACTKAVLEEISNG